MLGNLKRRTAAAAMAAAIAFALAGCYTMKTENVYHADGTIDFTMVVAMDDSVLAQQLPDSEDPATEFVEQTKATPEMEAMVEELGDKISIEPYSANGQSGLLLTMTAVTMDQIARMNAAQGAPAGKAVFTHADGLITLDYTADEALMQSFDESLASLEDMGVGADMLSSYVDFEARHTFPGPVKSTTIGEIDPDNPNSVVITDMTDAQSAAQYTIVASDRSDSSSGLPLAWMLAIGGVVVLGLAAVAWLVVSKRRREAPAVGDEPADLAAPSIEPGEGVAPTEPTPEATADTSTDTEPE